jgi:hypothetical protein
VCDATREAVLVAPEYSVSRCVQDVRGTKAPCGMKQWRYGIVFLFYQVLSTIDDYPIPHIVNTNVA